MVSTNNINNFLEILKQIWIGIASCVIFAAFGLGWKRITRLVKTRTVRNFWRPMLRKKISIVLTEYPSTGTDINAKTAQKASSGFLISMGNAMALSNILNYLTSNVTKREELNISGDKSGDNEHGDAVIIGSPANNYFAKNIFSNLQERFDIPFDVEYNMDTGEIGFFSQTNNTYFNPIIKDGNGVDYAMVIRAEYKDIPKRYAVMLAGAYMFGVQAAAVAVTSKEVLQKVNEVISNSENYVFMIKTNVINYHPSEPELEIYNQLHIYPLIRKNKNESGN